MALWKIALLNALAATAALASPVADHVLHEKRDASSDHHWVKRDRLPPTDTLPMRIGLAQRNLHLGYDLLMDVADPTSPNYGRHWTKEQIVDTFGPSQDSIAAVKEWLGKAGITEDRVEHSVSRGWVTFEATAGEAERLLDTEYYRFDHKVHGRSTVACDEYKVPVHVRDHIDFIHPGVALVTGNQKSSPSRRRITSRSTTPAKNKVDKNSCAGLITPECVQKLYKVPRGDKAAPGNSLGLFESGSWYSPTALDVFFKNFSSNIPVGTRPANVSIDISLWHYDELNPGEADLDVQMAFPLVYPQNVTIYQTDDDYYTGYGRGGSLGWFQDWLDAIDGSYCNYTAYGETGNNPKYDPVYPDTHRTPGNDNSTSPAYYQGTTACGTVNNTNVYSVSYGNLEGFLPTSYTYRQCNEFMKLGLMGTTVVVATGDFGTSPVGYCGPGLDYYHTVGQYPSNCPYVLTVGATMLDSDLKEVVANIPSSSYASAGGFSYNYTRPKYQDEAVQHYNKKYNHLPTDAYNATGRAFPDVSALGWNLAMVYGPYAELDNGAGTSASAPIVASIINRINEERLAVGKSPVGFVNPTFYKHPGMFNDIVSGNNSVCGSLPFNATQGWDPVTGLGTPDFPKMLKVFMGLP